MNVECQCHNQTPLYNYANKNVNKEMNLGTYIGVYVHICVKTHIIYIPIFPSSAHWNDLELQHPENNELA
jgi:hypothetical protein